MPALSHHKASGQAVVYLPGPDGRRRTVYLGPFGSPEARRAYLDAVSKHLADEPVTTAEAKAPPATAWPTVGRLVANFLLHAQQYYRNEYGEVSREVQNFITAAEPFLAVLRDRTTDSLTCADLSAVRTYFGEQKFGQDKDDDGAPIAGTGKMHSRTYVNSVMRRVRFVIRWGTESGLVPGSTWSTLSAFRSLTRGRGGLRETAPVEAVPRSMVDAIIPHLPPLLCDAINLLWWSGMRASELCNLRMRDVERGEEVWIYRPATHKGTWKGRDRVVRLGAQCIEILRPLLRADPNAYFFTPSEVMKQRKAAWRASRTSKVTPTQQARDERNAKKANRYGDQFDVATLRRAVHRACDDAGVPRWGLHRLRHAAGTRLVLEHGDNAARVQLGHADDRMVRRYSVAADDKFGREIAAKYC